MSFLNAEQRKTIKNLLDKDTAAVLSITKTKHGVYKILSIKNDQVLEFSWPEAPDNETIAFKLGVTNIIHTKQRNGGFWLNDVLIFGEEKIIN
ncbi:hypothetical protein KY334_05785 [Candidatus Woesearchaeota archaeon]|nr:hypothetical protein [Candidatus Woesearchaeota archaeon]